jgi:glucosylceramidase
MNSKTKKWNHAYCLLLCCILLQQCNKQDTQHKELLKKQQITFNYANQKALVYTTAHNSELKLTVTDSISFIEAQQPLEVDIDIVLDANLEFQEFLGIGAALTDAAAETFYKLSEANQELFMKAYFDEEAGIGYSLARTIIHSCDFSTASYTYVEEGDAALNTFSIEHDRKYRIPFTKRAIKAAGGNLTMYASPWSPPAFMKTNNSMLGGGKLKKEFYQPWANYFSKFIKAYEKEGIPIWGLSIQNEPMATQRWESCVYTAAEERDFLKDYLGPTLEKDSLGDKKIIVWDHNRDLLFQRANTILKDPEAAKYVWGTGFHWYEDWKGGEPMYKNVAHVNEAYPDKKLIFTEGCNEGYDLQRLENDDPKLAERYGKSMINDFNNGTVAWTDWNILLDETGGPNHVGNFCFSPVHGDTYTDVLTFTNSYYYIGHFSKFVRPGAKRISSVSSSNNIISTAFKNKNNTIAVVAMNTSDVVLSYTITADSKMLKLELPAHAIQTIVLK